MNENELIEGIIQHDRTAVHQLVDTYQLRVIKTAYYFLGNMEDAEDTAQDIFLEIIGSIGKFRGGSSLSTWIYRITVTRSLNALKRNRRRAFFRRMEHEKNGIPLSPVEGRDDPSVMDQFRREEIRFRLRLALGKLPGNQRTAFILSKYEDLSNREIAEIMQTSLSSVESLIHRAKMNLQRQLANYYNGSEKN